MNAGQRKWGNDQEVKAFFDVLGDPKDNWYRQCYAGSYTEVVRMNITKGETIKDSPPPLARIVVMGIALSYAKAGTKDAIYRRCLIVSLFLAAGRVAEVIATSLNLFRWCYSTINVYQKWNCMKTGKQVGIITVCDAESFAMDFYHVLGSFFIAGFGQETYDNHQQWLFKGIAKYQYT